MSEELGTTAAMLTASHLPPNASIPSNRSDNRRFVQIHSQRKRTVDEVLAGFFLVFVLYLTTSQLLYRYRCYKADQERRTRSKTKRALAIIDTTAFLSLLVYVLAAQVELRLGTTSNAACSVFFYVSVIFGNIAILCSYLVLWIRQRAFYRNPMLKHKNSKTLRIVRVAIILGVFLFRLSTMTFNIYVASPVSTPIGCGDYRGAKIAHRRQIYGLFLIAMGVSVFFQFCFLCLVIDGMTRHIGLKKLHRCADVKLKRMIMRLFASTGICVLSNTAVTASLVFGNRRYGMAFWAIIWGINLAVCAVAEQYCYLDFRTRVMPWVSTKRQDSTSSSGNNPVGINNPAFESNRANVTQSHTNIFP